MTPTKTAKKNAKTSKAQALPTGPLRVGVVTLGCDKNTVDNEYLAGMLETAGCEVVFRPDGKPLDAAVVTTCGFIATAKDQSIDAVRQLALMKRKTGSPRKIYVAGCLSQRYGPELMEEFPEIDGLVGVGQFRQMADLITRETREAESSRTIDIAPVPIVDIYAHLKRKPLNDRPHAFLKLSDGCNHGCTFCSIPLMKGKLHSVDPDILMDEARALLDRGVKEINLVAQDLSDYGRDRADKVRLTDIIKRVAALPGDFWIRCLYYYPGNITDEFLKLLASEPKIVPYLEMPLQHLHPTTLRRMKRPFHEKNTFETVEKIRAMVPGITLRSTVIVGFPGETEEEFEFLLEGLKKIRFDRLGAFEYSTEENTPAGQMVDQVSARTRKQRWRKVMETQAIIAEEANAARVGRKMRVLIEGFDPRTGFHVGRSAGEAPEVDNKVLVQSKKPIATGAFVDTTINGATTYDLYAELS